MKMHLFEGEKKEGVKRRLGPNLGRLEPNLDRLGRPKAPIWGAVGGSRWGQKKKK